MERSLILFCGLWDGDEVPIPFGTITGDCEIIGDVVVRGVLVGDWHGDAFCGCLVGTVVAGDCGIWDGTNVTETLGEASGAFRAGFDDEGIAVEGDKVAVGRVVDEPIGVSIGGFVTVSEIGL